LLPSSSVTRHTLPFFHILLFSHVEQSSFVSCHLLFPTGFQIFCPLSPHGFSNLFCWALVHHLGPCSHPTFPFLMLWFFVIALFSLCPILSVDLLSSVLLLFHKLLETVYNLLTLRLKASLSRIPWYVIGPAICWCIVLLTGSEHGWVVCKGTFRHSEGLTYVVLPPREPRPDYTAPRDFGDPGKALLLVCSKVLSWKQGTSPTVVSTPDCMYTSRAN